MAQLVVRKLDPEIVRSLKERAVKHGVSAEEEHRQILRDALNREEDDESKYQILKDILLQMPDVGDDSIFERIKEYPREIDLS